MDAAEKKRKMIIGAALVATLIAVVLVEDDEIAINTPETLQPLKTTPERTKKAETHATQLDVTKLGQRKFSPLAGELFLSTSWTPKQPQINVSEQPIKLMQAPKVAASPSAPVAPPLQFKYSGKAIEGSQVWVFLSQAGENFITKVGEKINPQYRLDAVSDETVTVTYLPLNVKQTLTINNKIAGNFR